MNDFRSEYQSAVQDMDTLGMKEIHIDALSVMDEGRHRKRMIRKVQRMTATTFSAVCVIFLCGFGTVKAAEYIGNVIKVSEWGFESGDAATMARSGAADSGVYVTGEEVGLALGNEAVPAGAAWPAEAMAEEGLRVGEAPAEAGMEEAAPVGVMPAGDGRTETEGRDFGTDWQEGERASGKETAEGGRISDAEPAEGQKQEAFGEAGQADTRKTAESETGIQKSAESETGLRETAESETELRETAEGEMELQETAEMKESLEDSLCSVEEIPVKNYESWEEFEQYEDIIFPQPSISIGHPIAATDIMVCGDWAMVRYDLDGKVLWMERTDYADTQGHASSKVFPGGVCNERSYTTSQGYTYTLVDSVKGEGEEELQIHAAITVGSYEAFIDFLGYTETDAKRIMDSIDLSEYE